MGGIQGHVFAAGLLTINNIYSEICLRSKGGHVFSLPCPASVYTGIRGPDAGGECLTQ